MLDLHGVGRYGAVWIFVREEGLGSETIQNPRRLVASPREEISAKCVSPCSGPWSLDRVPGDACLERRIVEELRLLAPERAYLFPASAESDDIADNSTEWQSFSLPQSTTVFCRGPRPGAVYLERGNALVTELDGRPLLLARGGSYAIAAVFNPTIVAAIANRFESKHGISPDRVNVYGFFSAPLEGGFDWRQSMRSACFSAKLKRVDLQKAIPSGEEYGYEAHPDHLPPNLGILQLR